MPYTFYIRSISEPNCISFMKKIIGLRMKCIFHPEMHMNIDTNSFAGINYGFEVMQTKESPNVPFAIFRTRFQTG